MRVFKKRDKWWIDFRDPQGVRRRKPVGNSKREAKDVLEKASSSMAPKKTAILVRLEKVMTWDHTKLDGIY